MAQTESGIWPRWLAFDPRPATSTQALRANEKRDTARAIMNAIGGVTVIGPQTGVRWRGQADVSWRLDSLATRRSNAVDRLLLAKEIEQREAEMIHKARQIGMDGAQHLGDWEILARLRHNGAITRLIDITTDPFIALFMLCDPSAQPEGAPVDGILLAIQRAALEPISKPWATGAYARMISNTAEAALVYNTSPIDARIAAQRGEFALRTHPLTSDESPECELFEISKPSSWSEKNLQTLMGDTKLSEKRGRPLAKFPSVVGILVPADVKPVILELLASHFGFTRETVYPDFAGLAEYYS